MKKIFRIENEAGKGIYVGDSKVSSDLYEIDGPSPRHPRPEDDSLLMKSFEDSGRNVSNERYFLFSVTPFKFGFTSVEQLRNWIYNDEWLISLAEEEFVLAVYEVADENVMVGNTQACYMNPVGCVKYGIVEYFGLCTQHCT